MLFFIIFINFFSNSSLGKTLASFVLDRINGRIAESDEASKCGAWQLKEAEIDGFYPIRESGTFQVLLKVRQNGAEKAKFRATVRVQYTGHLEMIFSARVDRMLKFGDCVSDEMKETAIAICGHCCGLEY